MKRMALRLWPVLLISACGGGADSSTVSGTLAGTLTGLSSSGLVLTDGTQTLAIAASAGSFSFKNAVSGSYSVTVATQPDGQTCAVNNGSGTITGNVSNITVSCRDYKLYVANNGGLTISLFGISAGMLTALSPATVSTSYQPIGIQLSPDGQSLFLTYSNNKAIDTYTVATLGLLTKQTTANGASAGSNLRGFGTAPAISPDSKYLYNPNYSATKISQFATTSTGLTALNPASIESGVNPSAMVVTPDGKFAYVVNQSDATVSQYRVGSSGTLTALSPATISTSTLGDTPSGIAVDPSSGHVYVTLSDTGRIAQYSVGSTGLLSSMNPSYADAGTYPQGIAVTADGKYLYVTNATDGTVSQFTLSNGKLTAMSPATIAAGSTPGAIAISPDSKYVYVANYGGNSISQYAIGSAGLLSALSTSTVTSNINGPTSLTIR